MQGNEWRRYAPVSRIEYSYNNRCVPSLGSSTLSVEILIRARIATEVSTTTSPADSQYSAIRKARSTSGGHLPRHSQSRLEVSSVVTNRLGNGVDKRLSSCDFFHASNVC